MTQPKIIISNRIIAVQKASNHNSEDGKFCIISCTDPNQEFPKFAMGQLSRECTSTLFLKFGDIDEPGIEEYPAITDEQAATIAAFVKANEKSCDTFYVNCDAGISRSSGVAAAISMYFYNKDSWIWSSGKYVPNQYVYRKVLGALGMSNSYTE